MEATTDEDNWNKAIRKTGCYDENETLQLCYADNGRDWRMCKKEMEIFKKCMELYQKKQELATLEKR
jgi:cytochrome c oxidase assembly factor 4